MRLKGIFVTEKAGYADEATPDILSHWSVVQRKRWGRWNGRVYVYVGGM